MENANKAKNNKGRAIREIPRILVIADAVAHTGFAVVCHSIFDQLYTKYDVHVLGINYYGDPHEYKYKIYPAATGGDVFGINRLPNLLQALKPHVVLMINDPWIVKDYVDIAIKTPVGKLQTGEQVYPHTIAYMPIDGLNIQPGFIATLNHLNLAIGYTDFAVSELKKAGLITHTAVIPHGINKADFVPVDKSKARKALNGIPENWFIVGMANRN